MQISISHKDKTLVYFLLKVAVLYLGWYAAFEFLIKPDGRLDDIITKNISQGIVYLMNLTGIDTYFTQARKIGETWIWVAGGSKPLVRVGASCNGLEPLVLFAIFIIAYPGKVKHKLWFIPAGLIIIHIANILRNYWLSLMLYHQKMEMFHLFHRYVFVFLIYLLIFGFWVLWANKFSKPISNSDGQKS